jgi:hypothetical protein
MSKKKNKLTPEAEVLKGAVEEFGDKKMDEAGASKLTEHAERELRLAGIFDQDADYDGMLGNAVLELVKLFASQHHSGSSGSMTLELFNVVSRWELLSEPTADPDEWEDVSHTGPADAPKMWQNKRGPAYFSTDAGKTWRHVGTDRVGVSKPVKKETSDGGKEKAGDSNTEVSTEKGERPTGAGLRDDRVSGAGRDSKVPKKKNK